MMEDRKTRIINQNRDDKDDALWGKPALSIIQGIEKNEKISSTRAIWEMVQNAHDVSIPEGSDIEFEISNDFFCFRHNGIPFTPASLHALNLQTSSKVQENIKQIGQYGTGFMTTNKFGLVFYVSGALRFLLDDDVYLDFENFKLDRSERNKFKLIKKLQDQAGIIDGYAKKAAENGSSSGYRSQTEFKYEQGCDADKENAREAFGSAPNLVPYVLAIIDRVNSISFSEPNKATLSFKRSNEAVLKEGEKYVFKCVDIERSDRSLPFKIYILDSKKEIEGEDLPEVSVVLPLKEVDGKLTAFQFEDYIPNLFIFLPLIGTEKWGINYIIHSPLFKCTDELRDSVRFASAGQYGDEDSDRNKGIINLADEIISAFYGDYLSENADVKYIAKVGFKTNDSNEKVADYYKGLQDSWVKKYFDYKITTVKDGDTIKMEPPKALRFLNSEMCNEAKDNPSFLQSIYSLMVEMKEESCVPVIDDLVYWSEIVQEWSPKSPEKYFITPEDVAEFIQDDYKVSEEKLGHLLEFDKYLVKSQHTDIFKQYRIIPTEDLELKKKEDVLKPEGFNKSLLKVMDTLIPERTGLFVHSMFYDLFDDYSCFTDVDANTCIKEYVEELRDNQSEANKKLKSCRQNDDDISDFCDDGISDSMVTAMLNYCSMIISSDSNSIDARLLKQIKTFYGIEDTTSDRLNDNYKHSPALKTLVYDCLFKFTMLGNDEKSEKWDWITTLTRDLYSSSDWKDHLKDYMVYPNQNGVFKYSEDLKKEVDMPSQLKEWYDRIIREVPSDDESANEATSTKSICHDLLNLDFANMFIGTTDLKGKELADELYGRIEKDTKWNIDNYSFKDIVLSLIELINQNTEWAELFPHLDENKRAQIMLSTVQDPCMSNSIFKFLRFDDKEKMAKLAELGETEDYDDIISYGRSVLEQRREEEAEWEYRNKLGKYVERFLRDHLHATLEQLDIKVEIPDIQGGQDMVVAINGKVVYYIEVKSIWRAANYVRMTMDQLYRSVEHKEEYALCIVNMEGISHDLVDKEEYPSIDEMLDRIHLYTDIGEKNIDLNECIANIEKCPTQINLFGEKVVIPINILERRMSLNDFCDYIKERIV